MRLVLFSALLAPLVGAPETPSVTVEAGTQVTKTFTNTLRMDLVGITIEQGGEEEEVPEDGLPEVQIADDEEIVVMDEYVSVDGGRGTVILRTFDSLRNDSSQTFSLPDGTEEEQSSEGESELEGRTVRLTWDGDEEAYEAEYADDEDGDESLLEGIRGDADFLFLLPDEDVDVGDSWTLDASVFSRISSPSGDLQIIEDGEEDSSSDFSRDFEDGLEGEFEATLDSIDEEGVAKITLEGVVETAVDVDVDTADGPEGLEIVQTFSFQFDLEGELLWDTERGVAASMSLTGAVELDLAATTSMGEREFVQTQAFEGTFEASAQFE
ncbi:MAG: hypothetical protein AAGB93_02340 [Planctomycetota bacterium]